MFEIESLSVSYGRTTVLDRVDLGPVEAGTVVGVLGANGAGKSTLLKAVAGLLPCSGTVHRSERRPGYVPQELPKQAALTAFESVLVSQRGGSGWRTRPDQLDRAARVLEELGIARLANRYVAELSGGQRQLVALAQAFVQQPQVLLLDEPTSALDLYHQCSVLELVKTYVRGREAVAVVSIHDVNLAARHCDRLAVLHDKRVYAYGTPSDVVGPELLGEVYRVTSTIFDDAGVPVISPHSVSDAAGGVTAGPAGAAGQDAAAA